jgi:signal transduction histidine kinase
MLVVVGLITWAVSGGWMLRNHFAQTPAVIAWAAFVAPFLLITTSRVKGRAALALLAVQSVCAVVMGALSGNMPAATLAVVAGQLPFRLSARAAGVTFAAQTVLFGAGLALVRHEGSFVLLFSAYTMFEAFTFGAALTAVRETRAKEALARVNAELVATQAVLEHSSRELERQRVSRELHDVLGHHLTALTLQLEVAKAIVEGRAAEPVSRADELARGALAEVRQIVSSLREAEPFDLSAALARVTSAVPGLAVHLDAKGVAAVASPRAALAVLRCVQEAVTNAARHSGAKNLWVEVKAVDGTLTVGARDDGRGVATVLPGNGLNGLKERMGELAGKLEVDSAPGRGFTLTASFPLGDAP